MQLTVTLATLEILFVSAAFSEEKLRPRRAVYQLGTSLLQGTRAVKILLKGTNPVPSAEKYLRLYEKKGGFGQTIRDFYSVGPTDVKPFRLPDTMRGFFGEVGDRILLIQNIDENSGGRPVMKIIQKLPSGEWHVDKIKYTE